MTVESIKLLNTCAGKTRYIKLDKSDKTTEKHFVEAISVTLISCMLHNNIQYLLPTCLPEYHRQLNRHHPDVDLKSYWSPEAVGAASSPGTASAPDC